MEREVVEMYAQDCRARAEEVFLPFRRLVGRGRTVSDPTPRVRFTPHRSFAGTVVLPASFLID